MYKNASVSMLSTAHTVWVLVSTIHPETRYPVVGQSIQQASWLANFQDSLVYTLCSCRSAGITKLNVMHLALGSRDSK